MSATTIEQPDRAEFAREHTGLVQRAEAFKVTNPTDHEDAQLIFRELKAAEKRVEDRLGPIIEAAHKAHKGLTSLRADILAPIKGAVQAVQRECIAFEDKQRRAAEEAQRIAQEAARKAEEERALADAIAAEQEGDKAGAEEILAAPIVAPVVQIAPAVAKVAGVSSRVTWGAEVVDLLALVKYVAAHPEWVGLIQANGPALNKLAQAQRDALKLPGVKAVSTRAMSARVG